jgi:uncharacterized protein (DUF1015 family)
MATVFPFRALRPRPDVVADVAAVPYDVVSTEEARALAGDNPLTFLRVSRPEIELPAGTDPYSPQIYERAARNFETLKKSALVVEEEPSVYVYRLRAGDHDQTGVAACYSIAEYEQDIIRKHERTRRDKEDDRTRHMLALGAQTGPVFLTYRASADVTPIVARIAAADPLFDFEAPDGVRHTLWKTAGGDRDALVAAFARVPALYIADGHHRAASAARASAERRDRQDASTFLAVAFPHDQVRILPYNRIVRDLAGLTPERFLAAVGDTFDVTEGRPEPSIAGEFAMYLAGRWYRLRPRLRAAGTDAIHALDVSVLQDLLLTPILGIGDVRTDKRIDFVGGARGTDQLERMVNVGTAAVAFALHPVSVADLMAVADAGGIMPPKSTWFEPKLRDGLLIHQI